MKKSKAADNIAHDNRVKVIEINAKMTPIARMILGVDVKSDMEYIAKHNLKIKYK